MDLLEVGNPFRDGFGDATDEIAYCNVAYGFDWNGVDRDGGVTFLTFGGSFRG
jgi:hypothetical protein